ncbi:uncharacterized protein AMSG_09629 [Thecamonas trahens ATCC 50062]|uniref:Uncharacterized protein n=1 Tax=Thecamonas trahens ATCC 50062 TaxID=461836 RepID=A0A0L0DPN1_THETB|nr:hypothetical protein AMSG_09629 [Thecamonas trahens ATCC 50062]KNC53981.1 hypothetical protein AMSG_09629 [Thecamonas trahens ATCC 50062]|eukprot:XP_013754183.1 hypothetical protein AMSG_09629 [Thecamonas trahens ATCC 50062]
MADGGSGASGLRLTFPRSCLVALRGMWVRSQELGVELAGVLEVAGDGTVAMATSQVEAEARCGYATDGYTVADTAADDAAYTFHTHPIEFDNDDEAPINVPNLISSEDMIGAVQDAAANSGFLSNPTGANMVDVLLSPLGIFVYGAGRGVLDKWESCEPEITRAMAVEYAAHFARSSRGLRRAARAKLETDILTLDNDGLKAHIAAHQDSRNMFFAEVENGMMNDAFDAYIGSWGYLQEGKGLYAEVIAPQFEDLGYTMPGCRIAPSAPRVVQEAWFSSAEFLAADPSRGYAELDAYLALLRDEGFRVAPERA